jgi:ubiquinone/menaquinone biosynthesis C-methylase UbiE
MQRKEHWESVYATKAADAVSWFQEHAVSSLQLIKELTTDKQSSVIDIGGGASTLADDLLAAGYSDLTVLDISEAALEVAKNRLGPSSQRIQWLVADITQVQLPEAKYAIWHDRAVFHFLTQPSDRRTYINLLQRSVEQGGHVVIATFAEDGPTKCSGLPVVRYTAESLRAELGNAFALRRQLKEAHQTPFGTTQNFIFCCFEKAVE